jgi:demethylspheroidene O-methyltransferase
LHWLDHGRNWRNRLLASPGFQRWAAAFPLTRPIARYRARQLFDLCAGFVYSQVLYACVKLNLFEILAEEAQTPAVLAERLQLPVDATERLLRAASSLGLVDSLGGRRYGLGQLGAALLGNPGIAAMVEHHALLYADLNDPVALLRGVDHGTALAGHWPYAGSEQPASLDAGEIKAYTGLMAASQPFVAGEILDAYPFEKHGHQCLLDVGGGNGAFLSAVAGRTRQLRLMLFDLPAVAEHARSRFEDENLARRATVFSGDMRRDQLPQGADIISLVRIVHDHDDAAVLAILRAVRRALPAHGKLLIAEPMSATRGAEPIGDAYFGFYLMAMGSGRPRNPDEHRELLRQAGFDRIRLLRTRMPLLTRLLIAQPAAD